jgi:hypothetical protein
LSVPVAVIDPPAWVEELGRGRRDRRRRPGAAALLPAAGAMASGSRSKLTRWRSARPPEARLARRQIDALLEALDA